MEENLAWWVSGQRRVSRDLPGADEREAGVEHYGQKIRQSAEQKVVNAEDIPLPWEIDDE